MRSLQVFLPIAWMYLTFLVRMPHTPHNSAPLISLKGKGKAVPLQAWSGPEGSRKLRFPDFMTTAQGGGKVVTGRIYTQEILLVLIFVRG